MDMSELLAFGVQQNASDLHLSAGVPPLIRVDGDLRRINNHPLSQEMITQIIYQVMTEQQQKFLEKQLEIDFSFEIANLARFRANVYRQARGLGGAFRTIPNAISTLDDLQFPSAFKELACLPRGLVLVTGPTGSGKSTTLAAFIDYINEFSARHIITIEDPIEFTHVSKKSLISQREVHRDTKSFSYALRSALREDPDIILVGELRDLETIRLALTAAETGHLVFATVHTSSATKTINRIIDVFPGEEKNMVRSMLSESLQAVIAQTLLKKQNGGRIPALEIMICTSAIRNLIREDKIAQMYSCIQTGQTIGNKTLDQHLRELVQSQIISTKTAAEVAVNKTLFE